MLTDAQIRNAKGREKPYKLFDAHRLFLLVTPKGAKHWRMNYVYDEKNKGLSFGSYPLITLSEARDRRDEARKQLAAGRDPAIVKKLKIAAHVEASRLTFERLAREWFENSKAQWAKVHAGDVLRSLERDVFPSIGALPISELKAPHILEVLRDIENRSAIETAKRIRQRISAVFVYAIACGHVETDPAEKLGPALKPLSKKGRQPAITQVAPLRKMLSDVDEDFARPITRLALRLLALTAVRPGELRGATWEEFDLTGDKPLWTIPAARMKGDLSRKDEEYGEHLVTLAPESVAVLRVVWKLTGAGKLVFPSNRHAHKPMSENALGYLLNRAGYHGRHVPHGFRASFSTIMNEWAKENGRADDREVIDLMLAHIPVNKVEGAYNRAAYMARRRELATIWAGMISQGLLLPDQIVPLPCKASRFKGIPKQEWGPPLRSAS